MNGKTKCGPMGYYSASKRREILTPPATTWMNTEVITLSEVITKGQWLYEPTYMQYLE